MGIGSSEQKGEIHMTTTVQKWGNSLAIRIPRDIADKVSIEQGSILEWTVGENEITLIPQKRKPTLEELLSKITPENRHGESDFGVKGDELL
jgi:antitoxin MazE